MTKVLVSDPIDQTGIDILSQVAQVDVRTGLPPAELKAIIGDYDALMIRSGTQVTAEIIEAATKLRIIGRAGVGVDNVDVPAATKRGVIVVNSPEGNTIAAAEHALALMLSLPVAAAGPEAPAAGPTSPTSAASKPAAKTAKAATGRQQLKNEAAGLALATATAETINEAQLEMAGRVLTGFADCEFKQRISVSAVDGSPGHFHVGHKGLQYRMVPQETSTGAVRLEDKTAGVMWLQIPRSKSFDYRSICPSYTQTHV